MSNYISVELIRKYLAGHCSPEEIVTVMEWFDSFEGTPANIAGLNDFEKNAIEEKLFKRIMANIAQANQPEQAKITHTAKPNEIYRRPVVLYKWIAVAATLLILLSVSLYFLKKDRDSQLISKTGNHQTHFKNDVLPGSNKAILTLANGQSINLTGAKTGLLARQGRTVVKKSKEGQLIYDAGVTGKSEITYNMISTPKGGQYAIVLADGTKVWLNAISSLRFPTAFKGKERNVELSGEAYFEVAKNKDMPFKVSINGVEVEVLGTHFNIKAYPEESNIKTTLLEGSVKISNDFDNALLTPGQQAVLNNTAKSIKIRTVHVDDIVAWQKGYYVFKHESIKAIMRELARWYDLKVTYMPNFVDKGFTGSFSRSKNLSELLNLLELTDEVHFKIDGKEVKVMP